MSHFSGDAIYVEPGYTILLKFIESFSFSADTEENTVDKLKDDYCFTVRTMSGKEYIVSTRYIGKICGWTTPPKILAQSIYDKWLWIHKS